MKRLYEFIEDNKGKLSAGRLVALASFIPATVVIVSEAVNGTLTDGRFAIYTGTYAGVFALGKMAEVAARKRDAALDA